MDIIEIRKLGRSEAVITFVAFMGGIGLWAADAFFDSYVFNKGSFTGSLFFDMSSHELYFRSFLLVSFTVSGFIFSLVISKRRRAEERLQRSAEFLHTIFDSIRDPFIILDRDFRIVRVNEAYAALKGVPAAGLLGRRCYEVTRGRASVCEDCVMERTMRSGENCEKEKVVTGPDGKETWVEIYSHPIHGDDGTVTHAIEYVRNITGRKLAEMERTELIGRLERLSATDSLTGLLNRRQILARLEDEIERSKRYGSPFALMFCDLDHFKTINDTHGHVAGDWILRDIAAILRGSIRASDAAGRYGGDEFLVILPETPLEGAQEFAERIRFRVQHSCFMMQDGTPVRTTCSIGVGTFTGNEVDSHGLISRIDSALYESKRAGKNRVYSLD